MRPTFEDLKTIWLLCYSRSAFHEAIEWIDEMDAAHVRSITKALVYAAVVAYGRPFTQSQVTREQRAVPLAGVSPPPHLATTHNDLLNLRNKVIGHKDAMPAEGHSDTSNMILLRRLEGSFELYTTTVLEMEPEQRKAVKELCAYFIGHCETKLRPLTRRYYSEVMRLEPGVYELLVSEPPSQWVRPRPLH
jgi:hypothetical protein